MFSWDDCLLLSSCCANTKHDGLQVEKAFTDFPLKIYYHRTLYEIQWKDRTKTNKYWTYYIFSVEKLESCI